MLIYLMGVLVTLLIVLIFSKDRSNHKGIIFSAVIWPATWIIIITGAVIVFKEGMKK